VFLQAAYVAGVRRIQREIIVFMCLGQKQCLKEPKKQLTHNRHQAETALQAMNSTGDMETETVPHGQLT
jgi:hypothetical protein